MAEVLRDALVDGGIADHDVTARAMKVLEVWARVREIDPQDVEGLEAAAEAALSETEEWPDAPTDTPEADEFVALDSAVPPKDLP
jgi:hypothetical protein